MDFLMYVVDALLLSLSTEKQFSKLPSDIKSYNEISGLKQALTTEDTERFRLCSTHINSNVSSDEQMACMRPTQ